MTSRLGSGGVSFNTQSERIITEAVRRARLQGNNDPSFVPPPDEFSFIQAVRTFASRGSATAGSTGRTLTIDPTHLTGTSYDGTADVTIGTDATPAATVSTIMARDASGFTAVVRLILGATGFIGDTGAGSLDLWVAAAGEHVRFLDHTFAFVNADLDESGNLKLRAGVGLFGKTPPSQAVAPTAAGAAYGATEQALLNDIRLRLTNLGVYA